MPKLLRRRAHRAKLKAKKKAMRQVGQAIIQGLTGRKP